MSAITNELNWYMGASPLLNDPLVPRIERLHVQFRAVVELFHQYVRIPFDALYEPSRGNLGFVSADTDSLRPTWMIVGQWIAMLIVERPERLPTLLDAHRWFWQGHDVSLGFVPDEVPEVKFSSLEQLRDLLPYILDGSALATRRQVLHEQVTTTDRALRKKTGAYYTPGDVTSLMVRSLNGSNDPDSTKTWLDPAQGTGVFLKAVIATYGIADLSQSNLYGIDINPMSAESASLVLMVEEILRYGNCSTPATIWHKYRANFLTANSLEVQRGTQELSSAASETFFDFLSNDFDSEAGVLPDRISIFSTFPEIDPKGFDRIIGNPPYAKLDEKVGRSALQNSFPVTGPSAKADISPVFLELSLDLLHPTGEISLVLPLSIVASSRSPFKELRQFIQAKNVAVEYKCFDRVPDALFGDDVKTRNTIVTIKMLEEGRTTISPLYRWTSRNRQEAFGRIPTVDITNLSNELPRIGSDWEKRIFSRCISGNHFISGMIQGSFSGPLGHGPSHESIYTSHSVILASTAYNYLGVIRDEFYALENAHDSQNPQQFYIFNDSSSADVAYALFNSRLAFWLWHVTGDGFHVTSKLRNLIPVPRRDSELFRKLSKLGDRLWKAVRVLPNKSINRNRTTVSFPTCNETDILDRIDDCIIELLGVQEIRELKRWHNDLVVVDPSYEKRLINR